MIRFATALAALALTGCGESNATPSEALQHLKPGKWQYWVLANEGKDWIRADAKPEGLPWGEPICLTPEDAAAKMLDPDPWFSAPFQESTDCGPKTEVNMAHGKFDGQFTCRSIHAPQVTHGIKVEGEFSGDRYLARIERLDSLGPVKKAAGERIGDCS